MIVMEPLFVGVAGGFVLLGKGVIDTVGAIGLGAIGLGALGVSVSVPVGTAVKVGNAVGGGSVGNGVKVTEPKLNKEVGVAATPWLGKTTGLGTALTASRERSRLNSTKNPQQVESRNKPGKSTFPTDPCWS